MSMKKVNNIISLTVTQISVEKLDSNPRVVITGELTPTNKKFFSNLPVGKSVEIKWKE